MDSDFAIVDLTPDLATALGITRKTVLVEALAMTGAAVVRGVYVRWEQHGRTFIPEQSIDVPREHEAALETLFCEARRLRPTDDAATIREADYQHANAPHVYGRVEHSRNPIGRRGAGRYK